VASGAGDALVTASQRPAGAVVVEARRRRASKRRGRVARGAVGAEPPRCGSR
jgi:hypothetical protein